MNAMTIRTGSSIQNGHLAFDLGPVAPGGSVGRRSARVDSPSKSASFPSSERSGRSAGRSSQVGLGAERRAAAGIGLAGALVRRGGGVGLVDIRRGIRLPRDRADRFGATDAATGAATEPPPGGPPSRAPGSGHESP